MNGSCVPLEALSEAAFLTDGDFRVVDCNARAVELLRAPSREAVIGRDASDMPNDHDLAAEFPTYLRERLTAVPFVSLENHAARDDGTTFVAEAVLHRLADGNVLIMVRDVTARVESLHRAEEANERLRAAIRDRMEFVSNVSHELRTPLTSMSYAIGNMLRGICGPLPQKAQDYLGRLQVDVKRLMTTVNDILDLRQMENGTLTLRKSLVPLAHLLAESADALLIQAQAKRQTLTVAPAPKEIYAEADRHKVERVFFNILSNAVKYTPEGGAIHASIRAEGKDALIQVDDNGIGIPPEALPRVSQRYFRVGDQVAGTGLGLSIVREIVELHGGTLTIQSPVPGGDRGTRVAVRLPACPGPEVVVVSGDEALIAALTPPLTDLGLRVRPDREGLDLAKGGQTSAPPARFILDGALPDCCLSELICQIRGDARLAQTPILVLSPFAIDASRRAEYARMRVDLRPWPLPIEELRPLFQA